MVRNHCIKKRTGNSQAERLDKEEKIRRTREKKEQKREKKGKRRKGELRGRKNAGMGTIRSPTN